jgi:hypothetical protein
MLTRRRLLFILGGAATGIWLASTGLVQLERRFVVSLGGSCSFCGTRGEERRSLVGRLDRPTRICDECLGLCCDILGEEAAAHGYHAPDTDESDLDEARVAEILRHLHAEGENDRADGLLADVRRTLDNHARRGFEMFRCSFCDAERNDVAKLISGPRVFICDRCTGDAVAVAAHVLRA